MKVFVVFGNMDRDFKSLTDSLNSISHLSEVYVQSGYSNVPKFNNNWQIFDFIDRELFLDLIRSSDIIISHAGVGIISESLRFNKKPIIIARRKKYNEHTNDHQYEFLNQYAKDNIFNVFKSGEELLSLIESQVYLNKPSRRFITNLTPMKEDLYNYLNQSLN